MNAQGKDTETLWNLKPGESAFFVGFSDTMPQDFRLRLKEIGLESHVAMTCLRTIPFEGPKIYQICDSVFSLDRDIAFHVLIKRADQ